MAPAEYFAKFARQELRVGDAHTFITFIEYQTQVDNKMVTARFELDPALLDMVAKGWVEMPGGHLAYLTEKGFIEMRRRHPRHTLVK